MCSMETRSEELQLPMAGGATVGDDGLKPDAPWGGRKKQIPFPVEIAKEAGNSSLPILADAFAAFGCVRF